eukprot:TRINITY_DN6572_c0_g2_i1.p2 TRINITY_DN6572_c0_g2~~TRINITY_DN6572_c0_g2_i1.p2  ORF type:complete len:233 (-),score=49.62 TRINITY_DN6572_c0_g2_i1:412-1110(-)
MGKLKEAKEDINVTGVQKDGWRCGYWSTLIMWRMMHDPPATWEADAIDQWVGDMRASYAGWEEWVRIVVCDRRTRDLIQAEFEVADALMWKDFEGTTGELADTQVQPAMQAGDVDMEGAGADAADEPVDDVEMGEAADILSQSQGSEGFATQADEDKGTAEDACEAYDTFIDVRKRKYRPWPDRYRPLHKAGYRYDGNNLLLDFPFPFTSLHFYTRTQVLRVQAGVPDVQQV